MKTIVENLGILQKFLHALVCFGPILVTTTIVFWILNLLDRHWQEDKNH